MTKDIVVSKQVSQAFLDSLENLDGIKIIVLDPKNTGQTFLGSFTKYAGIQIDWFGLEMCILFVVQLFIFSSMLGKMNGRFLRMIQWVHFLDFEVFGNTEKPKKFCVVIYLCIVGYSYIIFPLLTLLLWGIYLFNNAAKNDRALDYKNSEFLGGISVYLIGTALLLCILVMNKISWSNYRFKFTHFVMLAFSYVCFTTWQFMVLFSSIENDYSFKGLSSLFLTQSGIMMCAIMYTNLYENKFNLLYFLNKYIKKEGPKPDPERTNDLLKEIEQNKVDDDWIPNLNDINDMITIGRISEKKMLNAFGRGFQKIAMDKSLGVRIAINGTMVMLYVIILLVYSWLDYDRNDRSKLAFVCSIAVFVNDIYVYIMYNARIIKRVSILALILFCSRFFIMLGGQDYWVYGHLVIFIWLECIICLGIVERRLPYNTDMDINQVDSPALIKKTQFTNLARVPEFIFFLIAMSLVVSIVIAAHVRPQGVNLEDLLFNDGQDKIAYSTATGLSILLVISFFFIQSWIRALKRKLDNTTADSYVFLFSRKIDLYYITCICSYMVFVSWTIGIYSFIKNDNILVSGLMLPAIAFFFVNVFIIYMRNNYHFLEDTCGINKSFKYHNERVELLKQKARKLRTTILQDKGVEEVYGYENRNLVQKVMDLEVTRRQAAKLAKKMGLDQDDAFDAKFNRQKTGGFGRSMMISQSIQPRQEDQTNRSIMVDEIDDENGHEFDVTKVHQNARPKSNQEEDIQAPNNNLRDTIKGFKLDEESSEEDYDAITPEMRLYMPMRIDKKRKQIFSWRAEKLSFCSAFFRKKMRRNDYIMILSLIFMATLIIIYGAISASITEKNVGILFAITIIHIVLLGISMMGNIAANKISSSWERSLQVFSFVIIYVAGLIYLFAVYDVSMLNKDDDLLDLEELNEKRDGRDFITGQLIVIPFSTAFIAFCAKAYRDNTNGRSMTPGFWILLILNFQQGTLLTIAIFVYQDSEVAWVCLFALSLFGYAFVQYIILVKYSDSPIMVSEKLNISPYVLTRIWFTLDIIVALSVFIGAIIFVSQDDTISDFASASTVIAIAMIILFIGVLAQLVKDRTKLDETPIYHSPWIFPIYKYHPEENDLDPYSDSVVGFYILAFLVTLWAIVVTAKISPSWLGIAITCVIEALTLVVTLFFTNTNNLQYNAVKTHVDCLTIKSAWLNSQENLVRMLHIEDRASYVSYETWWRRRHDLRNYMLVWKRKSILSWPEQEEYETIRDEFESASDKRAHLRTSIEKWAETDEVDLDCWEDCQKFMYNTDQDVKKAYMAELETIIQFQLLILQDAKALKETDKNYLFKFIKEKSAQLYLVGIDLEISNNQSAAIQYASVISEIKNISPDKQSLFQALKVKFIEEERKRQINDEIAEEREEQKNEERIRARSQMSRDRQEALKRMDDDDDMPTKDMPDCLRKLIQIRKECKDNDCKFTDTQFDTQKDEEKVLGEHIFKNEYGNYRIDSWKRASELEGSVLFRDNASHQDINQGSLGDCYFLSALSVLGNERTRELFICQQKDQNSDQNNPDAPNHWKKTGCFMLQFYKDGESVEVIVDDWLPMEDDTTPKFARGGQDSLEIWPCIIEKAYAKLYGSFSAIETGKVHMALSDMVEGAYPEEIALKSFGNNIKGFENRLRKMQKQEILMGAASPEHEMGDAATSADGICFGHAYAIMKVQSYQGTQLLQMRNPHGYGYPYAEWKGDWGDKTDRWTERAKSQLKYEPNFETADGLFWMTNIDFLHSFKNLYAIREMSEKTNWTVQQIDSEWDVDSAGLKKMRNVPQFNLKINKPCSGFISLTQKGDTGTVLKGKNYILWIVVRNQGKVLTKLDRKKVVASTGNPTNQRLVSNEITFAKPQTFTIVCGSKFKGLEGAGEFEIKVFSRDDSMELTKLEVQKRIE